MIYDLSNLMTSDLFHSRILTDNDARFFDKYMICDLSNLMTSDLFL